MALSANIAILPGGCCPTRSRPDGSGQKDAPGMFWVADTTTR
jgi:hypothetical protein